MRSVRSRPTAFRALCLLVAPALLSGCFASGSGPPPLLYEAAVHARAGQEAYLMGEPGRATPSLREAARVQLAAGDLPGAARALLNLSLAERAAGDVEAARRTAARLRDLTPAAQQQAAEARDAVETPTELAAASAWLDALLALDNDAVAIARERLALPISELRSESPWGGRLETLRAELALEEARWHDALRHARAGQAASAAAGDRAEEARALRLAGTAHMRMEQWGEARTDLLAAIRIEEALAGGARMVGDLNDLAFVSRRLGDHSEAELYSQRARLIDEAR